MSDAPRPAHILLAHSDAAACAMAAQGLPAPGYEMSIASRMEEAVQMAFMGAFDLCVTGEPLDGGSGLELCTRLREYPHSAKLPILYLSARCDAKMVEHLAEAGATDFLPAPHDPILLRQRAEILLEAARCADHARQLDKAVRFLSQLPPGGEGGAGGSAGSR